MTDGCTGFWFLEWIFPAITQCCSLHDTGGTDGLLLDCLEQVLPTWTWFVATVCIAIMIVFRKPYNLIKKVFPWVK